MPDRLSRAGSNVVVFSLNVRNVSEPDVHGKAITSHQWPESGLAGVPILHFFPEQLFRNHAVNHLDVVDGFAHPEIDA